MVIMAASMPVCLFIPHSLLSRIYRASYVLGYCHASENNFFINCMTIIERKNTNFDSQLFEFSIHNLNTDGPRLLGLFYVSEREEQFDIEFLRNCVQGVGFLLRINEKLRSFHVDLLFDDHFKCKEVQVVIYDGYGMANSELLLLNKNVSSFKYPQGTFITFLLETCVKFENSGKYVLHEKLSSMQELSFNESDNIDSFKIEDICMYLFLCLNSAYYNFATVLFKKWPQWMLNVMLLTALGQQFHQRYVHCSTLCDAFKARILLNIRCRNLIYAILVDFICGCVVTYALLNTSIPDTLLNATILKTNDIVSGLQNLINWLMGVPAGLKLNIPLNNALGKFFLYHIYLWESYMTVVQPLFSFIFKMASVIGVFGLTFVLSLLNDLISLATIHIYCFYGYATRLYGYQVTSLCALWRLFRGKKWNPLRQRIDSYTYSVHQLYLGTLIFTVLLFLLPTVMVYYSVFTCLRILVLVVQGVLSRIINVLAVCPLYAVVLRIFQSSATTGDVHFTVLNTEGALTLSMQASQIPMSSVIHLTIPHLKKYYDVLTWKEFLSSIVWGKIVYPL